MELAASNLLLKADAFGHAFNFRIRRYTTLRTAYGFFMTLLLVVALLPFAIYRYMVMLKYGDSNILEIQDIQYFDDSFVISTSKHRFDVAFALIGWGYSQYNGDYSEYGQVKAYYKRWGNPGDPPGTSYYELKTRPCTDQDLGLGSDVIDSRFYESDKATKEYIQWYKEKLQCIDEDIQIYGDYNSFAVQHLSIQFDACDYVNNSTCKSYDEIR